jgi:hypothetical protein
MKLCQFLSLWVRNFFLSGLRLLRMHYTLCTVSYYRFFPALPYNFNSFLSIQKLLSSTLLHFSTHSSPKNQFTHLCTKHTLLLKKSEDKNNISPTTYVYRFSHSTSQHKTNNLISNIKNYF